MGGPPFSSEPTWLVSVFVVSLSLVKLNELFVVATLSAIGHMSTPCGYHRALQIAQKERERVTAFHFLDFALRNDFKHVVSQHNSAATTMILVSLGYCKSSGDWKPTCAWCRASIEDAWVWGYHFKATRRTQWCTISRQECNISFEPFHNEEWVYELLAKPPWLLPFVLDSHVYGFIGALWHIQCRAKSKQQWEVWELQMWWYIHLADTILYKIAQSNFNPFSGLHVIQSLIWCFLWVDLLEMS